MSLIGYARTSTSHQEAGLEAQIRRLTELGCDKIFSEQVSTVSPVSQMYSPARGNCWAQNRAASAPSSKLAMQWIISSAFLRQQAQLRCFP